jgi:POT family proton-dependent oligopeptide transporter
MTAIQRASTTWIGGFFEAMSSAAFWAMHAAIAAAGGLIVALFGRRIAATLRAP